MSNEKSRPSHEEAAPIRPGGPAVSLPVDPVIAPLLAHWPCQCREAQLLRAIGTGELPLPDVTLWNTLNAWIQASAVARLRQLSHALAGEPYTGRDDGTDHWHRVAARQSDDELAELRNSYDRPPRTPAQIRAEVRHSWTRFGQEAS